MGTQCISTKVQISNSYKHSMKWKPTTFYTFQSSKWKTQTQKGGKKNNFYVILASFQIDLKILSYSDSYNCSNRHIKEKGFTNHGEWKLKRRDVGISLWCSLKKGKGKREKTLTLQLFQKMHSHIRSLCFLHQPL